MWDPSLVAGQPDRFYGRPVYENAAMAAVASATTSVLFGDLSAYYTRIVGAPRVEFSRDYKFNTDQLALRSIIRVDGNLLDAGAIKKLVSANT
jgi:HK97 family phage major capsid protein